jgi:hypothetical protein
MTTEKQFAANRQTPQLSQHRRRVITNHEQQGATNAPRKTHNAQRKTNRTNPFFRMNPPNPPSQNPFESQLKPN